MAATPLALWPGLILISGAISFGALWLIGRWMPARARDVTMSPADGTSARFLFQDELMFDHHAGTLPPAADDTLCWAELRAWFAARFDGLPTTLADLPQDSALDLHPVKADDTARLSLLRTQHGTRITLCDPPHACPAERHGLLIAQARFDERTDAIDAAPNPIWRTSEDGTIQWQNPACRAAFASDAQLVTLPSSGETAISRLSITPPDSARPLWYEVHSADHPLGVLHHATDITKIVRAETMQKDFVQTLTKTFAYLTTGLAVFDSNRQLALFNPALVDLTALPAEFLSAQPDLMAFFDNLRNRRVMPEPRSYATWRTQIGQVIESAEGGLYQETWSLPNDVTYRVTGRPHPDGAVAFLFEDISAEVMLARRFRSQLDLHQASLDCMPEAVMVIGADNVLAFCNTATTRLLGVDPGICFADMTVSDLLGACATRLPAPAIWRDVETALHTRMAEGRLHRTIETEEGDRLACRVDPLPGGAHMITLCVRTAPQTGTIAALATG